MDVVRAAWLDFTDPLEGGAAAPVIYQDIRGKVTGPYGYLCDSASEVANLPLRRPDGSLASVAEKVAAYQAVKSDPFAAKQGWRRAATLTTLRLSVPDMHSLAMGKWDVHDRILRARCPDWDELPACARMALHSLAWACGANAHFPRLFTAVNARDFERAALEIHINEITPEGLKNAGLVPRNVANKLLMRNAARVQAFKLDPQLIEFRTLLGVDDAPTLPELPNLEDIYTPIPTENAATHPTEGPGAIIHPMPDTLDAWRRRDDPDDAA